MRDWAAVVVFLATVLIVLLRCAWQHLSLWLQRRAERRWVRHYLDVKKARKQRAKVVDLGNGKSPQEPRGGRNTYADQRGTP